MPRRLALGFVASLALALALASGCGGARTTAGESAHAGSQPAPIRYFIGGDSRGDAANVVPWAFHEAKTRGVRAFIFLGDMETKPEEGDHFKTRLAELAPIAFFPIPGNHDIAYREHGKVPSVEDVHAAAATFRARFFGTPQTPVASALDDKIAYSVDLDGGLHFVALDNVTRPGFDADQLAWLERDLERARATSKHIVVGMHKPLAKNGFTEHAMDEDGPGAVADSAAAIAAMKRAGVEAIFASHFHGFAKLTTDGIPTYVTGGLGAPLDQTRGDEVSFHHVVEIDVLPGEPLHFEVIRFPGATHVAKEHE